MKVKSIAECSPWSILQYFWPALSNKQSWKTIFGLLLSGHLRQVLLYLQKGYHLKADDLNIVTSDERVNRHVHYL